MRILFISNPDLQCGVADYGRRLYEILKREFVIQLAEVISASHYATEAGNYNPDIILYNYHYATMQWLTDDLLSAVRHIKHIAIFHEAALNFTPDKVIDTSVRPIIEDTELPTINNPLPLIGSFGFGFPDKNFVGIAELVKKQYKEAIIRLNIPFAQYGDRDGVLARTRAAEVRAACEGTGIQVEVNHDFLPQDELIQFLRGNDINLFLYSPSHGRGLASATDYALSAYRPIGVSSSEMFRHLPAALNVENNSIQWLIENWFDILKPVYEKHSNANLIKRFRELFNA